jgi:hypothetical protein
VPNSGFSIDFEPWGESMNIGPIGMIALAAMLAGCTSSSSDAIKPLPSTLAKTGFVTTIDVKSVPANVSPEFKGALAAELEKDLKLCATGTTPLRLEASVVQFKAQSAVATILIGGSNLIKGTVQLVDPATDQIVGDYDISRSQGGGGLIAAAAMAGPEGRMTEAFAEEVCVQAFGRDPRTPTTSR